MVADRQKTVSLSNNVYGHLTGVVYRFYRAHLPTHRNSCVIEGKNMKILVYRIIYIYIYQKTFNCFEISLLKDAVVRITFQWQWESVTILHLLKVEVLPIKKTQNNT